MEAEHSRPADGERSGRQEQQHLTTESSLGSCPPQQPQHPPTPRPVHRALGRLQNRQPKRTDLLLRLQQQQEVAWQHSDTPGPSGGSFFSPASSSTTSLPSTSSTRGEHAHGVPSQSSQESLEGVSSPRKGEKKPQKPGKYVCTYCGRPCAKPSVLQKHIRSHTGERPYPCAPCGFSFKTKSNLYKHRKSHAHRIKAGLASSRDETSLSGPEGSGVGEDPEEHSEGESTESEEETGQHRKSSSKEMLGQQRKGCKEPLGGSEESQRPDDSQAVKQRLALRLSERKRGPMASPDDPPSSLSTSSSSQGLGSKGSTESGYFSGSGSTDLSQVSPPSASAKTYAEIILGKYGRLGGQQRSPHQQQPHSSLSSSAGTEEKSIPFAVPKTQVIEHITKLITINEAVVDTSEIDSVKPRRSSLSRKSSMESPKFTSPRDPYTFDPKGEAPGPSGLKHLHNPEVDPSVTQELSAVPLLRSHSMPSSTSQEEPSTSGTMSPKGYRLCQSFDEQQAVVAEMRVGHAQRMLRRQPAIEVPLGAELMLEEISPTSSSSASGAEQARQLQQQQQQQKSPSLFECEACGVHFQHSEGYEAHRGICPGQQTQEKVSGDSSKTCREDRPQMMMHYTFRALALAARKRRKEESLEEDPPSPGAVAMSGSSAGLIPVPSRPEHSHTLSGVSLQTEPQQQQQQQQDRKGVSVIQHTSSFEKQESISMESQEAELRESQHTQQLEPKPSPSTSRLIRQPNIQVPEILVTVEPDADMPSVSPPVTTSSFKEAERVEEFQWPQRSQTLAQLPAEKLPPKKKRLRLAEAAQSSGESSFESASLPHSPSQESNISHASSLSASFEDTARPETAIWASSSQSSQMLMVPSASHQHHQSHKEMRRSASEQTTATPQQTEQVSETRSKSFDYGSLSPQQSASSWKERRKCLLVKHATLGEPEQEEGASMSQLSRAESPKPGPSRSIHPPIYSTEASSRFSLEVTGKALQLLQPQIFPHSQDALPLQQAFPPGSLSQLLPVTTAISEVLSTQITHRAFLHSQAAPLPIQIHPGQIHMAERLGIPFHQLPALVPLPFSSRTTANQALYLSFPPRLTAHVPSPPTTESSSSISSMSSGLTHQSLVRISYHHPRPVIATCLAQLTPVVSLVVPVRLQTHIPTYASAMYTTLSQILASTCSQEPISCTAMVIMGQVERDKLQRSYLKVPSPDIKSLFPLSLPTELASGSGEGYGPLGAGGSKRMLSPAASLELSTEAQRHQKRVKEEEEGEEDEAGEEEEDIEQKVRQEEESKATGRKLEESEKKQPERVELTTVKVEGEHEQVPRKHNRKEKEEKGEEKESTKKTSKKKEEVAVVEKGAERPAAPSYPSLHTSTSVNWCYLNYVKPNPSALRDPRSSVYSNWSVSAHNPNLPGLTTKVALSLLCSKQKHSSETYTMAMAPTLAKSKLAPASSRTPRVSEVHATPPSTLTKVKDQQQHDKEENNEMREEEEPSTSKQSEPSRVRIFEGGYRSNEEYVYVRGRGRGKYICGECGIRCKKPSMLKKHIRTHTDVRPYICKHCNFAFKTKGNLTKHMKSKAHGKKCQAMGVSESSLDEPESEETAGSDERVCGSEGQEGHQFSDVEDSEDDEDDEDDDDDDDDEVEESASHDDPSSCSSDTHPSTGGHSSCSRRSQQGTPDPEPPGPSPSPGQELSPRGVWLNRRAASPGSRRALFSRRGWKASPRAFSPSSESCSPSRSLSPRLELSSPIRSLSPRTELSSPSRHVSPSPERGPSPIRPLSPLRTISPSCYRSSQARTPPSPLWLQHRTPGYLPWESPGTRGGHVKPVKRGTAAEGPTLPEASLFPPAFRLSICEGYPGHQTADNIYSHLPKHSQQAKVPYLMIPIGGIQMVQASSRSHPTTPSSPTSPPMEGPSLSRFESYWGGTPRTQGLRTPGDHWSEDQTAGTSQSGRCVFSTALICSKQKLETTDSKQYGSSHSSTHSHRPATETTKHCSRDSSRATLSLAAPVASRVIGQQPEGDEPPSGGDLVEGGAKGDGTDQST
ncbi:transcription factor HIVEP3 [Cebidichthys violaceus]|uniref:transcription factor HIVEP3 n=1 Tax=Cebidichthys violaceus TaxID=271503 RepID=UPI0035CAB67D